MPKISVLKPFLSIQTKSTMNNRLCQQRVLLHWIYYFCACIFSGCIKVVYGEICSTDTEIHSVEEIRRGSSHYKYCAFGCCVNHTSQDPCCSIIGPVLGIIIAAVGLAGLASLCYCLCRRRRSANQHATDPKASTYSTVLRGQFLAIILFYMQLYQHA